MVVRGRPWASARRKVRWVWRPAERGRGWARRWTWIGRAAGVVGAAGGAGWVGAPAKGVLGKGIGVISLPADAISRGRGRGAVLVSSASVMPEAGTWMARRR